MNNTFDTMLDEIHKGKADKKELEMAVVCATSSKALKALFVETIGIFLFQQGITNFEKAREATNTLIDNFLAVSTYSYLAGRRSVAEDCLRAQMPGKEN